VRYYGADGGRAYRSVAGGTPVAYLHGDHLGSASLATDGAMNKLSELRYGPFGGTRYEWGSTPTDRRFTAQRDEASQTFPVLITRPRFGGSKWQAPLTVSSTR
jgi:hypothetical protein